MPFPSFGFLRLADEIGALYPSFYSPSFCPFGAFRPPQLLDVVEFSYRFWIFLTLFLFLPQAQAGIVFGPSLFQPGVKQN